MSEELTEETTIPDELDRIPMYLCVHHSGVESGFISVYERVFSPCIGDFSYRDILVWTGILADLNEDEFPIFAVITEEDLKL